MNSIIILVLTSAVFLLFVIPVDLSNNTDDLWINHTLGNDSDNLTDSYSVNINGVEYNEPTSTYYNVTDLDPHEFSNITEFALNNSEKGSFSAFPSSQIKQGLILGNSNSAPVAVDDNYSVNEDSDFNVIAPGILANDTDSDSSSLNAVLADSTTNGTLTLNTNGSFSYTPNSNFNGVDSFTYKANDNYDDSNIATVTITVNPVNDAPVAVGDSYSMDENTVLSVIEPGILINDNDLENNPLNAVLADSTTNGTLTLNTSGSFSYTPNSNFNGVDSFTYKANDSYDDSNIATVTITVNPVNDAPVAVGDSYSMVENTVLSVIEPGILINDNDLENNPLNAVLADSTTNGNLILNTNGSFSYTPNSNFNGVDSFTYKANDSYNDSNIAAVTITVNPVNDVPVAVGDSYSMVENTVLSVIEPGILGNDNDLENDPLNAVLADSTTNGTLTLNANGSFSYTPNSNFNGVDSFTYRANDGYDDSTIATVTITVNPVNDAPVAVGDSYSMDENTVLSVIEPGILINDNDLENNPLNAVLADSTTNGNLILNTNGSFSYTPNSNFNGVDSFTYKANDGCDNSNIVTVSITINPVNTQNSAEVPEFPTIALPVISVIGLMFLMQRRKGE